MKVENNENKKDDNKMEIEEEQNTTKKKSNKKKGFQDISEYSNFEIVDKNDPIGLDEEIEAHEISDEENENKNKKKKNNNEEFTHYNKLLSIKQNVFRNQFARLRNRAHSKGRRRKIKYAIRPSRFRSF